MGAIVEYSGLGNGFKIAMRDLEIRGAGSLFGAEQSGHIESVGYSMYLTLLNEAMLEIKGEKYNKISDVKIDCYFDATLPNYYVENTSVRMEIYSEIAKVKTQQEMAELIKKLEFNLGEVPNEVVNLIYVAQIKNACANLDVKRVSVGVKNTVITFNSASENLLKALSELLGNSKLDCVLNFEKLPIITIKNGVSLFITLENVIFALKQLNNLIK